MRRTLLIVILAGLVAACSSPSEVDETSPAEVAYPGSVVRQWLDAVAEGRFEDAHALVEPVGLAVVVAAENDLTADQLAVLLEDGVPGDLVGSYWSSFSEAFEAFRGLPLASVTVGDAEEFPIDGVTFAAVAIGSGEGSGEVITRRHDDGTWRIDLVATAGPGLAATISDALAEALESAGAETIAQAYEATVVPGFSAALARDPGNRQLVFDIEFIVRVLAQRPLP